jgi:hypothetical protein
MTLSVEKRADRYLSRNPDATAAELAGALSITPAKAREIVGETPQQDTADADPDLDVTISDHYDRVGRVYDTLGTVGETLLCPGNRDFTGWYNSRDGRGRAYALGPEWPDLRDDMDRVVYATVNYVHRDWFINGWEPYEWGENRRKWPTMDASSNTPGYGDIQAYAVFADIDLADDVKHRRPDGDIPKTTVERALRLYIESFAELAGDKAHVFALDSVGGAYVMVAPTATLPIAESFDAPQRKKLFSELADRANDWLQEQKERVNEHVPDAAGMFGPDLLNNKNRLYKAPMSVHSSLDGVVTPVSTDTPQYDYTPLQAVTDSTVADAEAWAEEFTADHTDAVDSVVSGLWPDYYADADSWKSALESWLDGEKSTEPRGSAGDSGGMTVDVGDVPDDIEETDNLDTLRAAIESIDVQDLARKYCSHKWDTAPGRDPPRFLADWHDRDGSGTSCFADRDKFVDLEEGANGGGPLKLAARSEGIITDCSKDVDGKSYWKAVNALRQYGYDVPYYVGKDGRHPDGLRLFEPAETKEEEKRQALRAAKASELKDRARK